MKAEPGYQITIVMVLHDINQAIYFQTGWSDSKTDRSLWREQPQEVITPDSIEDLYGIRLRVAEVEGQKMVMTV
ncbi:MAG: hypothetical protein ACLUJR_14755 [Mediterraneibacter gnavus]